MDYSSHRSASLHDVDGPRDGGFRPEQSVGLLSLIEEPDVEGRIVPWLPRAVGGFSDVGITDQDGADAGVGARWVVVAPVAAAPRHTPNDGEAAHDKEGDGPQPRP